ncbi:MAG: hypothetical protein GF421_08755 [Candidatus Aminicenantes bacterium]|nr:hypothetical protein [Candidatus Aminicenantes bacterium]
MKSIKSHHKKATAGWIVLVFLMTVASAPLFAQKKNQKSPGGYHGELDFPISWKSYYSYAQWTQIMHDIQKKYSHLSDIQSIGKTRMGRHQYLITITAKSTGKHEQKPAMWVDGAVHGNEVNGITCSLYLMWYLLTRYDYDPYVHDLVDRCTFYILPGLNVDANASYIEHPNTAHNPREPFRPEDNDGDGLYDEDRTEDVDGDSEISVMYIQHQDGEYKLSADQRRFVRVQDPEEKITRFLRIGSEGFDNDGDGFINEDDIGGPDPNRNYPSGWNLRVGNPYPMSEPCTRNAYEFMLDHPNIFAGFHYHNIGRLIMFVTPPRQERSQIQRADQYLRNRERYEEYLKKKREQNKYAQVFDIQVREGYEDDMDVQAKIVQMGARILKNYRPVPTGGMGQAQASTYDMLGAYGYLIELWGPPVFAADENDDGRVSDEEYLKWIDIELNGEGWVKPHEWEHPDLGPIWIGGTRKKHVYRTPPARYIEMEALKNAQFVMYCASQFPEVDITDIQVKPVSHDLYWLQVEVTNDHLYPTASDRSIKLGRTEKDRLQIKTSSNISIVPVLKGVPKLSPIDNRQECIPVRSDEIEFRLRGEDSLKFCILIQTKGQKGWIDINIWSQHGGTDRQRIEFKPRP